MASIESIPGPSDSDDSDGGYPRDWFTEDAQKTIDQRGLLCCHCQSVLRAAVQVTCGARFCEHCYQGLFR